MHISVIGAGSLGIALATKLTRCGYDCTLGTRDVEVTESRLKGLVIDVSPALNVKQVAAAVREATVIILAVPDDAIEPVCQQLVPHLAAATCVIHCAGALDSDVLSSARLAGCAVASLHPLNTFPTAASAIDVLIQDNHRTALIYEGDKKIVNEVIPVFARLGFNPIKIEKEAKPLYHAACVIACNLLTALMDVSLQTAELAGLPRKHFWQAIQPLLQNTIDNINDGDCASALSGPIARGDVKTIAKQLEELDRSSALIAATYRNLSAHALTLATPKLAPSPEVLNRLKLILEKER